MHLRNMRSRSRSILLSTIHRGLTHTRLECSSTKSKPPQDLANITPPRSYVPSLSTNTRCLYIQSRLPHANVPTAASARVPRFLRALVIPLHTKGLRSELLVKPFNPPQKCCICGNIPTSQAHHSLHRRPSFPLRSIVDYPVATSFRLLSRDVISIDGISSIQVDSLEQKLCRSCNNDGSQSSRDRHMWKTVRATQLKSCTASPDKDKSHNSAC